MRSILALFLLAFYGIAHAQGANPALTIQCPTCALSVGVIHETAVYPLDTVVAATYTLLPASRWTSGSVDKVTVVTGGTSTPSFTINFKENGTNVPTCNGLPVTTTQTATTCGTNTFSSGQALTFTISGISGAPANAIFQIDYSHTLP